MEHTKRYMLYAKVWNDKKNTTYKEEYDTEAEWKNGLDEFLDFYKDVKVPSFKRKEIFENFYDNNIKKCLQNYSVHEFDFSDGALFWRYAILDFDECRIIKYGGYDVPNYYNSYMRNKPARERKTLGKLYMKDLYFRGKDEIPKDYRWDVGEYEGWLQFRWGDGKNAVDYVPPKKEKKEVTPIIEDDYDEGEYEYLEEKYDKIATNSMKDLLMEKLGW